MVAQLQNLLYGGRIHWRLIPLDNNLAQRNVAPVAAGGGAAGLLASFRDAYFYASNPFDRSVRVTLEAALPSLLTERGWGLRYTTGAASFTLSPRAVREVRFELTDGADFTGDEVRKAGQDLRIRVRMRVDGSIVGGMSYALDPSLTRPPRTPSPQAAWPARRARRGAAGEPRSAAARDPSRRRHADRPGRRARGQNAAPRPRGRPSVETDRDRGRPPPACNVR